MTGRLESFVYLFPLLSPLHPLLTFDLSSQTAWRTECLILFHRLAFSSPFNGASAHCDSSGGCDLGTVLQTWHAYLRFAAMDETLSEKPLSKVFLPLLKSETSRICAKHRGKVVAAAEELEREFVEARPPLVPPPVTDAEE